MGNLSFFLIPEALGIIGFLIYGMSVMKRSLEKANGSLFAKTLSLCTKNDLSAVLFGTLITALVQSSAAITVTVVGLVDSGMLKLRRAIGVILGANVGTCVTSWLLSLTGIQSDNFFLLLLRADHIAAFSAVAGVILFMTASPGKKLAGEGLMGFGLVLFSVRLLSVTLAPLSELPAFREAFLLFENPLFGILAGAVITAVLQSSAASIGILQAMSQTGVVSTAAAVPIILGQNIGTTVTALIASSGTSVNARRSAFVHFFINLLGATVFMLVCFVLKFVPAYSASFSAPIDPTGIAWFHTVFNVLSTVVMLPFIGALEKMAMGLGKKNAVA